MELGEYLCLRLNNFFPKRKVEGRESPLSYSEAEYNWAKSNLSLYSQYIKLKDKTVLDAGCGLGGKTIFYAKKGCQSIIGIDKDENHITYAKEFAKKKDVLNAKFILGSLDSLPFRSNKFDIIFLNDVTEHIKKPILIKALAECKRIIKPNGRICIEFPPWTSPYASHLYDYIYTPWCQLLFSDRTLINVTKRMKPEPRHGKLTVIEHFQELNHITIEEFEDIIKKLDFKIINLEYRMIKNINILRYIPLLNKYLTSRVVAVLSK